MSAPTSLLNKAKFFVKHLLRDPKWTLRRAIGYFKPPLLVFQMGKVGSSSVKATLEARYFVCHFHTSDQFLAYREKYRKTGENIDIITVTRDPIGRDISNFFQNCSNPDHGYYVGPMASIEKMPTAELIERFLSIWRARMPDTTAWFDHHFKPATGMDVYDYPFDTKRGWDIIQNEDWRVLVLRFEDINRNYLEATNSFVTARFGESAAYPSLRPTNISSHKWYGNIMKDFKERVYFPKDMLEAQYDSAYCRHFYSNREIETMKSRWRTRE